MSIQYLLLYIHNKNNTDSIHRALLGRGGLVANTVGAVDGFILPLAIPPCRYYQLGDEEGEAGRAPAS
jgi:hypothetical protein